MEQTRASVCIEVCAFQALTRASEERGGAREIRAGGFPGARLETRPALVPSLFAITRSRRRREQRGMEGVNAPAAAPASPGRGRAGAGGGRARNLPPAPPPQGASRPDLFIAPLPAAAGDSPAELSIRAPRAFRRQGIFINPVHGGNASSLWVLIATVQSILHIFHSQFKK